MRYAIQALLTQRILGYVSFWYEANFTVFLFLMLYEVASILVGCSFARKTCRTIGTLVGRTHRPPAFFDGWEAQQASIALVHGSRLSWWSPILVRGFYFCSSTNYHCIEFSIYPNGCVVMICCFGYLYGFFRSALASFKLRACYANVSYDRILLIWMLRRWLIWTEQTYYRDQNSWNTCDFLYLPKYP